jgi:hypothetical protein
VIQIFSRRTTHKIKALAEHWFEPRLEECRVTFPRAVQHKLGEASSRGMAHSPPTYGTVEILAEKEVERCGQIFLNGYKQAFTAVSNPIRSATLTQVKRDLGALLSSESDRVLRLIEYVREACKPVRARNAVDLRDRTQRKLFAELDLFVAKFNSEQRGNFFKRHPVLTSLLAAASFLFGWLPQWGASVWSLFSSQALVPYVIEKIPALEKISVGFNWNFVTMPIGFGGAILLIWLLVRPARLDRNDAGDVIETNQHGGDFREP